MIAPHATGAVPPSGLDKGAQIAQAKYDFASSKLELEPLMRLVAERAMALCEAQGAVIELVEGDELVYQSVCGIAAGTRGIRIPRTNSLSGLCLSAAEPLICADSETDPRVNREGCRRVGLRSLICVPLKGQGYADGVLKVLSLRPSHFTATHRDTLKALSGIIETVLNRVREAETRTLCERLRPKASEPRGRGGNRHV